MTDLERVTPASVEADVSLATVQRLEAGKHQPDLDTLIKIAGALAVTPAELFGHDGAVA